MQKWPRLLHGTRATWQVAAIFSVLQKSVSRINQLATAGHTHGFYSFTSLTLESLDQLVKCRLRASFTILSLNNTLQWALSTAATQSFYMPKKSCNCSWVNFINCCQQHLSLYPVSMNMYEYLSIYTCSSTGLRPYVSLRSCTNKLNGKLLLT